MAIDRLHHIKIRGIASCVPERIIKIDRFRTDFGDELVDKFKTTTGIEQKHSCSIEHIITAGDLCYTAAEKLLSELSVEKESIDALLFVTQSPDYPQPATACLLQSRLGLSQECLAYDINLGCSGYLYGLHIAASYLQSGYLKKVLLLTGEANVHDKWREKGTWLFGEAGTATLLEYDETTGSISFLLRTQGNGFRHLIIPFGGYRHGIDLNHLHINDARKGYFLGEMDNVEVFNFSIRQVPILLHDFFTNFEFTSDDFDLYFFHQANKMILNQIRKKLKLPKEKVPISIDRYGNTSSASIPLGICDYFNQPDFPKNKSKHIIACGYGIGLSLAVAEFWLDGTNCLPVITTNETFEDGIQ